MTPKQTPVTAIVITLNEEAAIVDCLASLEFCNQVVVVDSSSADRTVQLARSFGADVLNFAWDGRYPKKKQWGMAHPTVKNDWVLHIDADEIVPPSLAVEVDRIVRSDLPEVAWEIPLTYHFAGRALKHGHTVYKRSLVRRSRTAFPEVDDLLIPGITEVEGHYQPTADGLVGKTENKLIHDDPDPISSWISRHNRYSDWESHLSINTQARRKVRDSRTRRGQVFERVPLKPLIFFVYSFIVKLGFLDGRPGFDYAVGLSWYYWLTAAKVRELDRKNT